jgi:hypothetical protein
MLVALSGLGCHNKGCDVAYVVPTYTGCFSGGCYSNWYPGPVMPSCYSGCYGGCYGGGCYGGGCYGGGCYGGWGGGCFGSWYGGSFASCYGGGCYTGFHRRFGCGGGHGGLFSCFRKRSSCSGCGYVSMDWGCYGGSYSPPIFGSALGMTYAPYTTPQGGMGGAMAPSEPMVAPSEVTQPVQPSQVPSTTTTPPAEVAPARPSPSTTLPPSDIAPARPTPVTPSAPPPNAPAPNPPKT